MDCFIVAGPPRSGTSLIAGLLHRLGVSMGDEAKFIPANEHNSSGYFEDGDFVFLNDEILSGAGGSVWNPPKSTRIRAQVEACSDRARYLIQQRTARDKFWGWKDPRNCLTLDVYREFCKPAVIVCNRDPNLSAESIKTMNPAISLERAHQLSCEYYERIIGCIRTESMPHLIMHHEITLMDPATAIQDLIKFTGIERDQSRVEYALDFVREGCR